MPVSNLYYRIAFSITLSLFFLLSLDAGARAEEIDVPIEIKNPIFTTKGIKENPYEIKASMGIQKGNSLELVEIEGKLKTDEGIWIYLNADKGNFNQESEVIFLFNNIIIYNENNENLVADEAIVDINEGIITLFSNVKYFNEENKIKAEKSIIKNNFTDITYSGNVQTYIITKKLDD